eukprot:2233996-Pyramimonas_sp.AAC.2
MAMHEGDYKKITEVTSKAQSDMMAIYSKHNCNPLKSLAPILVQAPTFITFFFAVRSRSRLWPKPI